MINPKEHPEYKPSHGDMDGYRYIEFGEVIPVGTEVWEFGIGPWNLLQCGIGKQRIKGKAPMRIALPTKSKWEPKPGLFCSYDGQKYSIIGPSLRKKGFVVIEDKYGNILNVASFTLNEWVEAKEYRIGIYLADKFIRMTDSVSFKTHEVVWPENGEPRIEKVNLK